MDNVLIYNVNGRALKAYEDKIEELMNKWLREENNKDVIVSTFAYEDLGSINIDCIYLIDEEEVHITRKLAEQLLNKLSIPYELEN